MRLFIDEPFKWAVNWDTAVVLNLPASQVFDYLTDVKYHQLWAGGTPKEVSDQQLELGSIFTTWTPAGVSHRHEVTELVPDQRLAHDGGTLGFCIRRSFDLQSVPGGTRVTYRERQLHFGLFIALTGLLLLPLTIPALLVLMPPIRLILQWRARRQLRRIEDWESSPEEE